MTGRPSSEYCLVQTYCFSWSKCAAIVHNNEGKREVTMEKSGKWGKSDETPLRSLFDERKSTLMQPTNTHKCSQREFSALSAPTLSENALKDFY